MSQQQSVRTQIEEALKKPQRHVDGHSWATYQRKVGEGQLRIYNAVDHPLPLVISIKGQEYVLLADTVIHLPSYKPKDGDLVFDWLRGKMLEEVVQLDAERIRKQQQAQNPRTAMTIQRLRKRVRPKWERKTIVVKLGPEKTAQKA